MLHGGGGDFVHSGEHPFVGDGSAGVGGCVITDVCWYSCKS